ncbi:MAG: isocitrate lyase/phosphoenolpyruvate mutase family protein [Nitrospinae bacterium]|nr:isocitrate lyase/phosphoenolpyruvate mutase family protein [Nitrospinota bacterium]
MVDGGLRKTLESGKRLVLPGAYNAFAAKQIAQAGFAGVYISGAGLSNSLGVPDDGSLGIEDFLYLGGWIVKSAGVPVLCDADTGFQNAGETVKRYIGAGISGLHIEDQVFPKRCGHLAGKEVVPADEMAARIRDAASARDRHGPEFLVVARTDARGASNIAEGVQFEEAVARGRLYREAGADAVFPEALRSREEFARYRKEVPGYLLANMTEFGQTPFITAREFVEMGYDMVVFPVSLFRYHAGQTRIFLSRLREDGTQEGLVPGMMSRAEINQLLDYKP